MKVVETAPRPTTITPSLPSAGLTVDLLIIEIYKFDFCSSFLSYVGRMIGCCVDVADVTLCSAVDALVRCFSEIRGKVSKLFLIAHHFLKEIKATKI
jgi:hypothetical protein